MSRGPDAGTLLQRALLRHAAAAGCTPHVASAHATRWASATFTGAQHRLTLEAADDTAFAAWLAALHEADHPVRGHVVADVRIAETRRADGRAAADIEALTVET